jgi:hypothetical protein
MSLPAAYKDPVSVSPPYVCRSLPLSLHVLRKIIYVQLCREREHNSLIQSYPGEYMWSFFHLLGRLLVFNLPGTLDLMLYKTNCHFSFLFSMQVMPVSIECIPVHISSVRICQPFFKGICNASLIHCLLPFASEVSLYILSCIFSETLSCYLKWASFLNNFFCCFWCTLVREYWFSHKGSSW